jgi:thiamine biosynthesis lipoprotein
VNVSGAADGPRMLIPPVVQADRPPRIGDVRHVFDGCTMGTTWRVLVHGAPALDRAAVAAGIQARLEEVVAQMSTWEPASDLSVFNRAPAGTSCVLPAAFAEVLACALAVASASGGAFDPTVGPIVDAWGFGPQGRPGMAGRGGLDDARARCGWRRIDFDAATRRLRQPGGAALDLSAIAKGYGVDRVAAWLDARGLTSHLVEVGGELKGSGVKPDGTPWWVALEHPQESAEPAPMTAPKHPQGHERPALTVALNGLAVATSGDYQRWFAHDGQRYAHTVDPATGAPVQNGVAAASVFHADCMTADAWSTALTVLGADAGIDCADRHGLAARLIERTPDGLRERLSAACAAMLT